MVKLKIAGAIFLTLCYKTPLASELTHVQLHLAAFNHHFFKHTLSDLRKGNPRADEHLRKHDHHLCRCNTFFRTGIFRHLKRRKPHQRVRTHKLGNDCSRNCNHRTRSRIHFCLQSRLEVNTLSVSTNAILAIVLIIVGLIGYHEAISWSKVLGVAICLVGLYFINKK